jgi:tripartite ATP-independent transporter DctM subunit
MTDSSPSAVGHWESKNTADETQPGWLQRFENLLVCLALAAMALLPLAEIVLRAAFSVGISGSNSFVQHLTLIIGMLGGAIAARENRLLSLSTGSAFFKDRWKNQAALFSGSFGVVICFFLCVASLQFVQTEREAGSVLAYDIPVWLLQLIMPAGFGFVGIRLLYHAGENWRLRLGALALSVALIFVALHPPLPPAEMVVPGLAMLLTATVLGTPIFATLGGAALIFFWGDDLPIASIPLDHYRLVINPSLPAIPLFTLAGYFLAEGGASNRLVKVFQALVGRFRGGPAVVTALVCAFFTSFTGASGVTILALGGLLMPVLLAAGYSEKSSLGLLTGAGSLGLLFPPCLPLILYAIVARITMEEMFLGGIVPGVLLVVMTAWWGVRAGPRVGKDGPAFSFIEAWLAVWEAKWELLLPVVAFAGLFGGFATPVEAAALTALYAFVVETVIYRDLKMSGDVARVMTECGLLVGGVLLILGVALGFTNYLVDAQIPARAVDWVTASIQSRWVFLLLLNLLLLVVGCLMDIFSAIVVVVPLIVPMGVAYGIDPVHLGIIFLANLELGYLTPPVGMNLFLSSYRFSKPLSEVYRSIIPILLVLLTGVLLITYVPALTTTLPRWLER